MIVVPEGLPKDITEACEPCRALPRAAGATWQRKALSPEARWAILRKGRTRHAVKWPKLAGEARRAHVAPLLARMDSETVPTTLLDPAIEATWLWLEVEKSSTPSDTGELIVDFWAGADVVRALESLVAFAAAEDRGTAAIEPARRLRAHLSVAPQPVWEEARLTAARLAEGAEDQIAALLAYQFPEDVGRSTTLARKVKKLFGYQHLLALSVTDPDCLATLVKKGGNAWGLMDIHGAIPAWAVVTMGKKAGPVLDAMAKGWPQNVAAEREWLASKER